MREVALGSEDLEVAYTLVEPGGGREAGPGRERNSCSRARRARPSSWRWGLRIRGRSRAALTAAHLDVDFAAGPEASLRPGLRGARHFLPGGAVRRARCLALSRAPRASRLGDEEEAELCVRGRGLARRAGRALRGRRSWTDFEVRGAGRLRGAQRRAAHEAAMRGASRPTLTDASASVVVARRRCGAAARSSRLNLLATGRPERAKLATTSWPSDRGLRRGSSTRSRIAARGAGAGPAGAGRDLDGPMNLAQSPETAQTSRPRSIFIAAPGPALGDSRPGRSRLMASDGRPGRGPPVKWADLREGGLTCTKRHIHWIMAGTVALAAGCDEGEASPR